MKKILFASQKGHVPYAEGGGEVIAFDLLSEMQKTGSASVKALGSFDYMDLELLNGHLKVTNTNMTLSQQGADLETLDGNKTSYPSFAHVMYQMENSYTTTLARNDHYFISLEEYITQFAPDACLLQAEGAVESWQKLRQSQTKTFLYVQNGFELNSFRGVQVERPQCLANSKFIQEKLKHEFECESELLYPAINCERYRNNQEKQSDPSEPLKVLFVNPNSVKGLGVFLKVAENLKNVQFITLEGWAPIDTSLHSHFQSLGNVAYLTKTWDMSSVYDQADLLIAPSQWDEAFGRVVVEAHAAGLPTLASNVGGLPEASGRAGFLVNDFRNPGAWFEQIKFFSENRNALNDKKEFFEENVQRFTPQIAAKRFLEIIDAK